MNRNDIFNAITAEMALTEEENTMREQQSIAFDNLMNWICKKLNTTCEALDIETDAEITDLLCEYSKGSEKYGFNLCCELYKALSGK